MTTLFKSPTPGIAVMALSALGAAPSSTGALTNEAAGPAGAPSGTSSAPDSAGRSDKDCGTVGMAPTSTALLCDNSHVGPGPSPDRCPQDAQYPSFLCDLESTLEDGSKAPSLLPCLLSSPSQALTSTLVPVDVRALPLKRSLAELTRQLVSRPNDEDALSAVCVALRDGGRVEELVALLELRSNAEAADSLSDYATAELSFRIAKGSTGAHARELCRTALDLCPVHADALSLFEQLADASWADELCARYQIFLEDAPAHGVSPDICEVVTNRLVEAEHEVSMTRLTEGLFCNSRSTALYLQ